MNLNKKLIVIGMVLLIVLWTGNIIYYEKHAIKEPLFIKHYYDVNISGDIFKLYYVQNINSKDKIINIVLPEIGQQYINFAEYDMGNTNGPYYKLKVLMININNGSNNKIPDEYKNKFITKAQITFSNGKTMNVNLGKIYLYSDKNNSGDLVQRGVTETTDSNGSTILYANKDINITGINSRFYDGLKDVLKINIGGVPLSKITFPIKMKAGETIDVSYAFNFNNKNDIRLNNAYNLTFNILMEDSQGKKGSSHCLIDFYPYSSDNININVLKDDKGVE